MNWGLSIARDAIVDLGQLDPWLQEEALDELELLCAHPPRPRPGSPEPEVIHDFERKVAGVRQVVFIRLRLDDATLTLSVLAVIAVVRPPLARP